MTPLDTLLSVALGIGLAAAVGLRVFLPLLVVSIAAWTGHLTLANEFAWVGTGPALATFAVAALVEVIGYYMPGVDNMLDSLAIPVALLAGTLVAAAVMADMPPLVKWTTAVIAGGGVATAVQTGTAALRGASTLTTAGTANPIISTVELATSILMTALAVLLPILAFVTLVLIIACGVWMWRRGRRTRPAPTQRARDRSTPCRKRAERTRKRSSANATGASAGFGRAVPPRWSRSVV